MKDDEVRKLVADLIGAVQKQTEAINTLASEMRETIDRLPRVTKDGAVRVSLHK